MDGPYIFSILLAFSGIFNLLNLDTPESKSLTLTKGMNEISIYVSYIFGNKQNSIKKETYQKTEELGSKRGQIVGPNRPERQTNSW